MANEFESWEFPFPLPPDGYGTAPARIYLAAGDRVRLVASGYPTLDDLLALTVEAPGVLVAPTKTVETVETVDQLVESAWLAVLAGQARLVIEWSTLRSDGTVLRPGRDGLVTTPAITPERLARAIRALGRPCGSVADAYVPLDDWLLPEHLRPGAVCPRGDRLVKNGRWFLTDGRRVRSVLGGDASLSDLEELARCLPVGIAFVATGEKVVFWDPPLASVEELASEAWLAVYDEQVHRVVSTAADIDADGRTWVSIGHRYARREFRAVSTGDTHLLALTHDQLLNRLRALSRPGDEPSGGTS